MELAVLWAVAALSLVNLGVALTLLLRRRPDPHAEGLRRLEQQIREEMRLNREETAQGLKSLTEAIGRDARDNRLELAAGLKGFQETTEARLEKVREVVEGRLRALQEENGRKLEEMRLTVDEKLQASVEKRFNDSFRLISERLEQVHKGLGEMQTLAGGVGDLKRVLTNVKTRGTLGEIQLGAILEQFLAPEQYERNAVTKPGSLERVEYAVRLPGRDPGERPVLLPVDSKFPVEDYQRLLEAYDSGQEPESAAKAFESAVRKSARDIRDKYLNPPVTTDFALLFVPTEGLYAEILRRTGLFESLQREMKITVVGPGNLAAFLNSLQMGFRTLAVEKRSSEVWEMLGAVKTEFGAFGEILEKTRKKLTEAANVIDRAGVRSRAIERQLRQVQALPEEASRKLLEAVPAMDDGDYASEDDGV